MFHNRNSRSPPHASGNAMARMLRQSRITSSPFSTDMLPQFFEEGREKTCVWFTPGCKCALGMTPTDSSLGPARLPVDNGNNPAQYMPPPPVLLWRQPNGYHPLINDLPLLPDDFDAEPYFRPLSPSTAPSLESSPEPSPGLPPVELPAGEVDPADEGVEHAYEGMRFADEELNPANEEVGHADEGVASADEEVASESEEADSPTCVTIIVRPGVPEVRNTDQDGQKAQGPEEDLEQRLLPEPGSCFCLRPDYWQNMVQCEGEDHPGGDGWYHYSCAGLAEEPPETEPWFCGYCKGDHEPGDFFRRIGHGGKRLPGAFSPSPDPPVENDERYPETIDLEQDPLNCSSPSDPSQRKRKAERSGSEQPRKRPKIKVTVDNELPGSSATSGLPQAKRKLANPEVGTPHKKHKITADKGGFKMPQHEASEPQTPSSSANSKGSPWSTEEEDATIKIMQDVVDEQQIYGDKRWTECAKRLKKQYAVNRSAAAIKNQWNRVLRARSGVDERKHPNPSRMTTGSLTPKKRKRAQLAFPTSSVAAEDEEEGEEEEEEEEEENVDIPEEDDLDNEPYAPPRKRSLRGGTEY